MKFFGLIDKLSKLHISEVSTATKVDTMTTPEDASRIADALSQQLGASVHVIAIDGPFDLPEHPMFIERAQTVVPFIDAGLHKLAIGPAGECDCIHVMIDGSHVASVGVTSEAAKYIEVFILPVYWDYIKAFADDNMTLSGMAVDYGLSSMKAVIDGDERLDFDLREAQEPSDLTESLNEHLREQLMHFAQKFGVRIES